MRKVEALIWEDGKFQKKVGLFLGWGLVAVEGQDRNFASCSVAIIELENGQVVTPCAEKITFLDRVENHGKH